MTTMVAAVMGDDRWLWDSQVTVLKHLDYFQWSSWLQAMIILVYGLILNTQSVTHQTNTK